ADDPFLGKLLGIKQIATSQITYTQETRNRNYLILSIVKVNSIQEDPPLLSFLAFKWGKSAWCWLDAPQRDYFQSPSYLKISGSLPAFLNTYILYQNHQTCFAIVLFGHPTTNIDNYKKPQIFLQSDINIYVALIQ
ncbi:hypothetical protein KJ836_01955, partial [Patescibacteria group bacterium]|nr:hypothetical protein [Patescibacteria group bacterium]